MGVDRVCRGHDHVRQEEGVDRARAHSLRTGRHVELRQLAEDVHHGSARRIRSGGGTVLESIFASRRGMRPDRLANGGPTYSIVCLDRAGIALRPRPLRAAHQAVAVQVAPAPRPDPNTDVRGPSYRPRIARLPPGPTQLAFRSEECPESSNPW